MEKPNNPEPITTPKIKSDLWKTRSDQIRVGGSPSIDSKFGDDVCKGDTLSDAKLLSYYNNEVSNRKKSLSLPEEKLTDLRMRVDPLTFDPDYYSSQLDYYKKRGMDVTDGEAILKALKLLPKIDPFEL